MNYIVRPKVSLHKRIKGTKNVTGTGSKSLLAMVVSCLAEDCIDVAGAEQGEVGGPGVGSEGGEGEGGEGGGEGEVGGPGVGERQGDGQAVGHRHVRGVDKISVRGGQDLFLLQS